MVEGRHRADPADGITLAEAADNIGRLVMYRPHGCGDCQQEVGEIKSVSASYVMVLFVGDFDPKACLPVDLEF